MKGNKELGTPSTSKQFKQEKPQEPPTVCTFCRSYWGPRAWTSKGDENRKTKSKTGEESKHMGKSNYGAIFLHQFRLYMLSFMFRFMFANTCFEKNQNIKIHVMFITKHNMK